MAFGYPVMLEVRGRRCLVIGGGSVAEGKARGLLAAGAGVTVISPALTKGLEDLEQSGMIRVIPREYVAGDLKDAFIAIAATNDFSINAAAFREGQERGVLVNSVDDVEHCHFAAPSVVRRGDFVLAVSTGGKAPALARKLRAELEARFGEEYGALVDLLGEVRQAALKVRTVDFAEWARRWEVALQPDLARMVREGRLAEARDAVRDRLGAATPANASTAAGTGKVTIVGAGPGDPSLITVRGKRALEEADVVVYDRLVDPGLIQGKESVYAGKTPGGHAAVQEEINELLIRLAGEGKVVVRLKGGDPFVFGRGAEEAEALATAGIAFEVVPGPTSATAALAAAGIPVTDRRLSSSVAIVTGHCGGPRQVDWRAIAAAVDTIVVLMGLASLPEIVKELIEGGRDPDSAAAVVENATLPSQRVVTASLAGLPSAVESAGLGSPSIIVVGEVVRLRERLAAGPGRRPWHS